MRSFLQVKGGVNKGIRETLKNQPDRFLAYNNGLAATADEIEVGTFAGETVIHRIRGLQVVNGGQTLASVHRAREVDKMDISHVAVAMKLTCVDPNKLSEFVPLIAKYANTQNVIQVADLSANSEFHIHLEQLAERTWCPGEESRWFYERARGSYIAARNRYGKTDSKKREFDRECPKGKVFGKTDLAKYVMSWWQQPHTVSRGAQKNFSFFMDALRERKGAEWQPDEDFFKETVAQALLFSAASAVVRKAKLQSYGAQVTAYMLARLASDFVEDVDLMEIWEEQKVPEQIIQGFAEWAPKLHAEIGVSAGKKNVGNGVRKRTAGPIFGAFRWSFHPPPAPPSKVIPNSTAPASTAVMNGDDPVAVCASLDGMAWAKVIEWSAHPGRVAVFDRQVAHSIAGMALQGWVKMPTAKQAKFGARVVKAATDAGIFG